MGDIWTDPAPEAENTGVVKADPPAAPSEVVEETSIGTSTAEESAEAPKATAETPPAGEQAAPDLQSETTSDTPDVKREARRVFMETQRLGGFDALKEAYDLQTAIQNPELDAKAKLEALYHAAPRAFEDLQKDLFFSYWDNNQAQQDALDRERYGASSQEIKEALAARGQVAPSAEPEYDPLEDEYVPDAVKAELRELRRAQSPGSRVAVQGLNLFRTAGSRSHRRGTEAWQGVCQRGYVASGSDDEGSGSRGFARRFAGRKSVERRSLGHDPDEELQPGSC